MRGEEKRSNDDHSAGAEFKLLQVVERSEVYVDLLSLGPYVWTDVPADGEGSMSAYPKVNLSGLRDWRLPHVAPA